MKRNLATYGALLAAVLAGCTEKDPTASLEDIVEDLNPRTVEVLLPFEEFSDGVQVLGGYGTPATMGRGILAKDFQGLNSRVLIRFGSYPDSVRLFDAATEVATYDKEFSLIGGRLVLFFDTVQGVALGPADISASALQQRWDVRTVNWEVAVDTLAERTEWLQPGGGFRVPIGSGTFDRQLDRAEGDTIAFNDSVSIAVDSAQIAAWADTSDASRGVLIALEDPGRRIVVESARLRLIVQPSMPPDSLVEETAVDGESSFIYDPLPGPLTEGLRVGGAPSWRSVISLNLPRVLDGPPEVCAIVPCPFDLREADAQVNLAELVLTTREIDPAYELFDSLNVDLRAVVSPELLPKSPLGRQLSGAFGKEVQPELFTHAANTQIAFPATGLITDLMLGDSATLADTPNTVVFLSIIEPPALGFASFHGPGSPRAPVLRLLLTVAGKVRLP